MCEDAVAAKRAARDDDAQEASEHGAASEAPKRKRTARQEALQVDGAKVMRAIVTAAVKRRLPKLVAKLVKRQRVTGAACEMGRKRKREVTVSDQKGKRLAMRTGPTAIEHV